MKLKVCNKCGEEKPLEEFGKNRTRSDGYTRQCKKCRQEYRRRYRKNNPDKVRKQARDQYSRHSDVILKINKKYSDAHKEEIREYKKQWYEDNRDHVVEYKKKWAEENKENIAIKRKIYNEENKEKISINVKIKSKLPASFNSYAHNLTVDESPKIGKNGMLMVRCAQCGEYFYPTRQDVRNRVQALKGNATGECRLYCSKECKILCPIYNKQTLPEGHSPEKFLKRANVQEFRNMVLERDNYLCVYCGNPATEVHHKVPVGINYVLENDIDNAESTCDECHTKEHVDGEYTYIQIKNCVAILKEELEERGVNLGEVPEWALSIN